MYKYKKKTVIVFPKLLIQSVLINICIHIYYYIFNYLLFVYFEF